jgi:hypothetical protein
MERLNTMCDQCRLSPVGKIKKQFRATHIVGIDGTTMKVCEHHKSIFVRYIGKYKGHVRWKGDVMFEVRKLHEEKWNA